MRSCLYSCEVYHDRRRPSVHAFKYRLFYFSIDLDELPEILRSPVISKGGPNLFTLEKRDHFDLGKASIRANLVQFLREAGYAGSVGQITLVTQLRTLGFLFNPVSFYFIHDEEGSPTAVVAEVANTYYEQKLYFLGPETLKNGRMVDTQEKLFYISPFSDVDTQLLFRIQFPGEKLRIAIHQQDAEGEYFKSGILGDRRELNMGNLIYFALRFPLAPFQVMVGIHWHALLLFLKKIPVRRKSAKTELQLNTRRYQVKSLITERQPAV